MKFWDIFWTTWKVRTSIKIQQNVESSFTRARADAQLNANLPQILQEIINNENNFGSFLEKQRKLIQVEKALKNLPQMKLTTEEQQIAKEELLKVKQILES